MFSAVAGALRVFLNADASGLERGLRGARAGLGGLEASIGSVARRFAAFAAAIAGPAVLIALTKSSLSTIDAQGKLAVQLGTTTASIQALQHAASLSGMSMEALTQSAGKMGQRLSEAARTGKGPAYEALRRLGLEAKTVAALPLDQRLVTMAQRMDALGYTADQRADTLRQFGIRSREMLNLLENGGSALAEARKEIEQLGIAVSETDFAKVERANDAWTRARTILTGIGNQLATQLAPFIGAIAEGLVEAAKRAGGFGEMIKGAIRVAISATAGAVDAMETFIDCLNTWFRLAAGGLNLLAVPMRAFTGDVRGAQVAISAAMEAIGSLRSEAGKPPRTETWVAAADELVKTWDEAAGKVAASREKMRGATGAKTDPLSGEERAALEKRLLAFRASLASEDEALRLSKERQLLDIREFSRRGLLATQEAANLRAQVETEYGKKLSDLVFQTFEAGVVREEEALKRAHERKLEELRKFEENRTLTTERAAQLRRAIEERYTLDVMALQAKQWSGLAGIVDSAMSNISAVIGDEGSKSFGIMKMIASATALVKGYEAMVSAYAAGSAIGGPPVGAAFAAVAAASTAAMIAKINGAGPRSGGSVSAGASAAGSAAAATPAAAPAQQRQPVYLSVHGDVFGRAHFQRIAEGLGDLARDGAVLDFMPAR